MSNPAQQSEREKSIVETNATGIRLRLHHLIEGAYWHDNVIFISIFGRTMVAMIGHNPANQHYEDFMKTKGITFDEKGKPTYIQPKK